MTANEQKPFEAYYAAKGMAPAAAARAASDQSVMKYAFMIQTVLGACVILGFVLVTSLPAFAQTDGMERLHVMGWIMCIGLAICAIFASKARSYVLWIILALTTLIVMAWIIL